MKLLTTPIRVRAANEAPMTNEPLIVNPMHLQLISKIAREAFATHAALMVDPTSPVGRIGALERMRALQADVREAITLLGGK